MVVGCEEGVVLNVGAEEKAESEVVMTGQDLRKVRGILPSVCGGRPRRGTDQQAALCRS